MSTDKERILEGVCARFVDSKLAERQTFCSRFKSDLLKLNAVLSESDEVNEVALSMVMLAKNRFVSAWPNDAGE